jgi:hypothetical protein
MARPQCDTRLVSILVTNSSHHPKKDLALVALEDSQNCTKSSRKTWHSTRNLPNYGELSSGVWSKLAKISRIFERIVFFKPFWVQFLHQFTTSSLENKILLLTKPMLWAQHPAYHDFMSHKVSGFLPFSHWVWQQFFNLHHWLHGPIIDG